MTTPADKVNIPKRDLIKARTFKIIGWVVIAFGLSFLFIVDIINFISVSITIVTGVSFLRKGKQYSVERGELILEKDSRQPIVYLRTFHDKDLSPTPKQLLKGIWKIDKHVSKRKNLSDYTPFDVEREQRAMARIFRKIGPYVALGKPGETLPELGSLKLYVSNETWQETILTLLRNARLVIFNAGKSEGLRWELNQIIQSVNPLKLLLILPIRDDVYADFIMWGNDILPCKFPNEYPSKRLVVFNEHWIPEYLNNQKTLTRSLQPYFKRNGISVKESYFDSLMEFNDWN